VRQIGTSGSSSCCPQRRRLTRSQRCRHGGEWRGERACVPPASLTGKFSSEPGVLTGQNQTSLLSKSSVISAQVWLAIARPSAYQAPRPLAMRVRTPHAQRDHPRWLCEKTDGRNGRRSPG
jgi:hypothetical protein